MGRGDAKKYLSKAREFSEGASDALANGKWNVAGLAAIHAGISAADAVIVAFGAKRSASKDHGAAVDLVHRTTDAGAAQIRQLTGLLAMKNTVEYEQRLLTQSEARTLVEQSSRFVKWAATVVDGALGRD